MFGRILVLILVSLLNPLLFTPAVLAGTAKQPHVLVKYKGVDAEYGEAIARLVEAAYKVYVDDFGFDMPKRVTVSVELSKKNKLRLYTDGHDRVTFTLRSSKQLRKPSKSGTFNVYGFCHELGHIAMYRTLKNRGWLNGDAAEGWAHYCGSYVVDKVYDSEGEDLWPDPYDYRADGMKRLKRQLAEDDPDPVPVCAGKWRTLVKLVGRKQMREVFKAWNDADIDLSDPDAGLRGSLLAAAPEADASKIRKWFKGFAKRCVIAIESSDESYKTISRRKLSKKPMRLIHDDGKSDGKRSIAGNGHAVFFDAPGAGEWYVTRVSTYGSRYGRPHAPDEDVKITLCDEELKPIRTWTEPYKTFERGEPKWYRLKVQPSSVPSRFAICFNFSPTGTKEVFVHYDQSSNGHSGTGLPGRGFKEMDQGEWMIRVELDQPKSANSLVE